MSAKRLNTNADGIQIEKTIQQSTGRSSASNRSEWHNDECKPKKEIDCIIPIDLLFIMRECERKCGHNDEFAILLKGSFVNESLMISKSFIVPEQEVTGASIDFLEDFPSEWNGVMHKHPASCKSFSSTDETYINSNFDFSLLYVDQNITTGICNVKIDSLGFRVRLPTRILFSYPNMNVDEKILKTKIRKKVVHITPDHDHDHVKYRRGQIFRGKYRGLCLNSDDMPPDDYDPNEDGDNLFNFGDKDRDDISKLLGLT